MTLITTTLAIMGVLLGLGALLCILVLARQVQRLEERVRWLAGTQPVDEEERKPEPEIPDILKAGATQPPGSA